MASGLSDHEVDTLVTGVIAMADPIGIHFLWRPQLRDPGDENGTGDSGERQRQHFDHV